MEGVTPLSQIGFELIVRCVTSVPGGVYGFR